ncbi:hypothetical protein PISMIDRAFT_679331 [Pisolithus microcarpus 441]|uniref:Uncharacterized protein n=1 Tax=Pisolithus microcarpus 441 TaxID=765257 RepID=A0A0C9ZLY4_9AGAM|nr:hypothetical protein BKA83DRAFT_679331 [Pisolithus microcarpus]KIK23377.1 hypothetical protein PISMIDRAFT_679331 [Pisolithus microcarpus 441]
MTRERRACYAALCGPVERKRKKERERRYGFQRIPRLSYPYLAPLTRQTKTLALIPFSNSFPFLGICLIHPHRTPA